MVAPRMPAIEGSCVKQMSGVNTAAFGVCKSFLYQKFEDLIKPKRLLLLILRCSLSSLKKYYCLHPLTHIYDIYTCCLYICVYRMKFQHKIKGVFRKIGFKATSRVMTQLFIFKGWSRIIRVQTRQSCKERQDGSNNYLRQNVLRSHPFEVFCEEWKLK